MSPAFERRRPGLGRLLCLIFICLRAVSSAPLSDANAPYNTNQAAGQTDPLLYTANQPNTNYTPSPQNWRFPFYTLMLDRFADGNPANNDIIGTIYETDDMEVTLRHGGDVQGLADNLDYFQTLGIQGLYIAGTPFTNMPWDYHGYNPLDSTLLDEHFGSVSDWRAMVAAAHQRGIYVVIDVTVATMGDLIQFDKYGNATVPLNINEYTASYKTSRTYADFQISNSWNSSCVLPRFWGDDGLPQDTVDPSGTAVVSRYRQGCYDSEFDHYGDMEAFGVHPNWERQLGKFNGLQDRLRDWNPRVQSKLTALMCLAVEALDIDGIRLDKATQMTADFLANFAPGVRSCASRVGKNNFLIVGEVTGSADYGAIYLGRGRQSNQRAPSPQVAMSPTAANGTYALRGPGLQALDGYAFHFSIYRGLLSFLGLDGKLSVPYDVPVEFTQAWSEMLVRDDNFNANTGAFDPRHMFGVTNQDTFRWPSLHLGKERARLGMVITTLVMPGIPLLLFGEEQEFYIQDSSAENYVFGRQAHTSTLAWQTHGCFQGNASGQYYQMPFESGRTGCLDDSVHLDHFDPSNPTFNFLQILYASRKSYPVLNEGFGLNLLGNWTEIVYLPGSLAMLGVSIPSEFGLWSVSRTYFPGQNIPKPPSDQPPAQLGTVWLLYHNYNTTKTWSFDCGSALEIRSPFLGSNVLQNILPPYDTISLQPSSVNQQGCLPAITLAPFGFAAYVPNTAYAPTPVVITSVSPSHDQRILRSPQAANLNIPLQITFSDDINCDAVASAITFESSPGPAPTLTNGSCTTLSPNVTLPPGVPSGRVMWSAVMNGVGDGIHRFHIKSGIFQQNNKDIVASTRFQFRVGLDNNPVVFPNVTLSDTLLVADNSSQVGFTLHHAAVGADQMRISTDFGHTWSGWVPYTATSAPPVNVSQFGHVIVQYWCHLCGSSAMKVASGVGTYAGRRFQSMHVQGEFNLWGMDQGIDNSMTYVGNNIWEFSLVWWFPTQVQFDVYNDNTLLYVDIDGDGIIDRQPPVSQSTLKINLTYPPQGYLGWRIRLNEATHAYTLEPRGSTTFSIIFFMLLLLGPLLGGLIAIWLFKSKFYVVKHVDARALEGFVQLNDLKWEPMASPPDFNAIVETPTIERPMSIWKVAPQTEESNKGDPKTILIGTLEYEIPDWKIKVRIGGLFAVCSLMGRFMHDRKIIWVVPKVSDVEYPEAETIEPIYVTVYGKTYAIETQVHIFQNIKYIILDAPIFRSRSTKEPYPTRMDDLESAVFYSSWNQALAAIIARENPDIYHIQDYHGALAPLYLLPAKVPVVLTLHNAEFQGLWPIRTAEERKNVCMAFNISEELCTKYVQFSHTFNLLHAGASYIRLHQRGRGAAGVSDRYGKRVFKRYPALWGLKKVEGLPNPNPKDFGNEAIFEMPATPEDARSEDTRNEEQRIQYKLEAQRWAGLTEDKDAILFVFVGRWSKQKGMDLIADLAPKFLSENPKTQLICIGPLVDLYGKLAALKFAHLMKQYPNRVYSRPEFVALPNCIFRGPDFVFIPSRDEPFGLVAVEFGRFGVLGIGAFVGGLGTMPGWWFTIESTENAHLLKQLESALAQAMKASPETLRSMRSVARRQRFPVEEWIAKVFRMYRHAIVDRQVADNKSRKSLYSSGDDTAASRMSLDTSRFRGRNQSSQSIASERSSSDTEGGFTSDNEGSTPPQSSSSSFKKTPMQMPYTPYGTPPVSSRGSPSVSTRGADSEDESEVYRPPNYDLDALKIALQVSYKEKVFDQFMDEDGAMQAKFSEQLEGMTIQSSMKALSIDYYINKFEKQYYRDLQANRLNTMMGTLSRTLNSKVVTRFMSKEIRKGWPVYTIMLMFGQLVAASAFQLVLLTNSLVSPQVDMYITAGTFLIGTVVWWVVYRRFPPKIVLTIPFYVYSISMLLLIAYTVMMLLMPVPTDTLATYAVQRVAVCFYTFASASGPFYFTMNFATDAGSNTSSWITRASVIEGIRQLWVGALWYWATASANVAIQSGSSLSTGTLWALFAFSLVFGWIFLLIGLLLPHGLPEFYLHMPSSLPGLLKTLFRRKLVLWFLFSDILRNYWLSAVYGRSWEFLWQQPNANPILIGVQVVVFFGVIWGCLMWLLARGSKVHSWLLPIFAVGLIAPRWAQIWWATANYGMLSWAGPAAPYVGTGLWLWLGILDAIQSVGLGIILLQTLTRVHVTVALVIAQVSGAVTIVVASLTAPNRMGPGDVFPNPSAWTPGDADSAFPVAKPLFWVGLGLQFVVALGYLFFFRKEQLSRP
ncbi:glycoside hydrolase family 13 and glycosyltransferase family 5 domain-containing protein [Polychytrium aggregatum]|uniref:glycoside hydrolase family 13 and glycosyltransferase family 5 domain-containing protein n=1 Tax=Polychytrium aggregatum TaxID=110093 RepID=UPI0022FDF76C|nr:glycoside hydrolase family 13 and glycosyltransferase family 5 domain-containing protein [Polychytrium aggregatum]KAI9206635.1 glycoside hydrolase family 13 and glycosyltransferase family 5 domain-containing protein [Polychytrium aggregatum]